MPNTGKSPAEWTRALVEFADSKRKNRGQGGDPPKGEFKDEYEKIKICPAHSGNGAISSFVGGGRSRNNNEDPCNCNWHNKTHQRIIQYIPTRVEPPTATATATPANEPDPVDVPLLIPEQQKARESISDVRGKCEIIPGREKIIDGVKCKVEFDLLLFGPVDGKCPHCGGTPKDNGRNISIKTIHTSCLPRFVQGMGLRCTSTSCGKTWQSFEKGYVDTLPKQTRGKLNAIIVGKSDGIDMELVTSIRSGDSAANIQRNCVANLMRWHSEMKTCYRSRRRGKERLGVRVGPERFPKVEYRWAAKQEQILRAFIRDYLSVKDSLYREMASLISTLALAIDHQAKVVKHAKGDDALQSFSVVSETGHVLGYYCVPNSDMKWVDIAMKEIVERHGGELEKITTADGDDGYRVTEKGALPDVVYVDCDCCNGQQGGRTDDNKFFFGMIKILDAFHLILRIGREINSEHARKAGFMRQLSQCIFTSSTEDMANLEQARRDANLSNLDANQQRYDRRVYVRRVIREDSEIVAKILLLLKTHIAMDREARLQFELGGKSCVDLTPAHDAYPLVTKKVKACVVRQCTHILNGCVSDVKAMNLSTGESNYRGTGIYLPTYKSGRGSSKVEAVHSVVDRGLYNFNNIRQIVFDARAMWKLTNYNRERTRNMGQEALPDSIAACEVEDAPNFMPTTFRFGFDYCHHALENQQTKIDEAVRQQFDFVEHEAVMQQIDNCMELDVEDFNFEPLEANDDTTDSPDSTSTNSPSAASDNTMFITEIPDSVDFATLEQLNEDLEHDLELTNDNVVPTEVDVNNLPATLGECLECADRMAADAGIDLENAGGAEDVIGIHLQNVNRRRNVANRRAQNQQTPVVTPEFNDAMSEKWYEIWADPEITNPQEGNQCWYKWYFAASKSYETWRIEQLLAARANGTTPPPLFKVSYTPARKWAIKMKSLSQSAHASGVVNAATAVMRDNLDLCLEQNNSLDNAEVFDEGIGAAQAIANLTICNDLPANDELPTYELPTPDAVDAALKGPTVSFEPDQELLELLGKKTSSKKKTGVDTELQQRMDRAAERMKSMSIQHDPVTRGSVRCAVCFKLWSYELSGIPHKQLGRKGLRFCPFADEQSLLTDYMKQQKERAKERDLEKKRKKRAKRAKTS